MVQSTLGGDDAWQWIVQGWRSFMKNPLVWIAISLAFVVSLYLLSRIPYAGPMAMALLSPVLIGVMLLAAREVDSGRRLAVGTLRLAFNDRLRLVQLVILGLLPLLVTLLQKGIWAMGMPNLLGTLLGLLLTIALACALLLSLPRVVLDNRPAVEAVPESLRACLRQPLPVAVFLGLGLLLLLAALIPLGMGVLVYVPVMVAAWLACYRRLARLT